MDRIAILVFSIAFSCALLVAAAYSTTYIAPFLQSSYIYWTVIALAIVAVIMGAIAIRRRQKSTSLGTSR